MRYLGKYRFQLKVFELGGCFTVMNYFSTIAWLGGQELWIVFFLLLLLFGAKKLPELARGIGKSMGEFKKAREDFEKEITTAEVETKSSADKTTEKKTVDEKED